MSKKIFAISTLLLVLVVGAIFIYNFAFKKTPSSKEGTTPKKTSSEGTIPTQTTEKTATESRKSENFSVSAVSDEPVFGPTLSPDGSSLYYFLKGNGQLNQVDFDGKLSKVISTEKFENIRKIIWNKQKNKVIVKTELSSEISKFLYFDIAGGRVSVLKDNTDSVSWIDSGEKIAYKYYDPKTKKRTISVSDPDGKNWRDITEFDYQRVEISPVPGSSNISFWLSPTAFSATSVNFSPLSGEGRKEILRDKFGVDILWSPDGRQAAVSFSDQKGGHKTELAIMNSQGGQFQSFGFSTFTSKCTWSTDSKHLFCALPGNISESTVLPNDWQEGKLLTADTFWKIEVATGKKERLVEPEKIGGSYDVLYPFLAKNEKALLFINKADGKLYKLAL